VYNNDIIQLVYIQIGHWSQDEHFKNLYETEESPIMEDKIKEKIVTSILVCNMSKMI